MNVRSRSGSIGKREFMRNQFVLAATMMVAGLMSAGQIANAATDNTPKGMVLIKGGSFKNTKSNYYSQGVTVSDFYIGRYLVTEKEWTDVMGSNPSKFAGDNLPVENVNWY